MKKVALKLSRLSGHALYTLGRKIKDDMTANADVFTIPPVDMATLGNNLGNLLAAQQDMIHGGKAATLHRNAMRRIVEANLTLLAGYVEVVANGDTDVITLAGMTPKQTGPRRIETLSRPVILGTESARSGEVKVRWRKVAYAKTYVVEYCADPLSADGWQTALYNTSTYAIVRGLERRKDHWFRVRAIGTLGITSEWSDVCVQLVA